MLPNGGNQEHSPLVRLQGSGSKSGDQRESKDRLYREWLDKNLLKRGDVQQKEFVGRLLRVIGKVCQEEGPYNPSWVTHENAFQKYIGRKGEKYRADRWQCATGLPNESGRWLAVIRYSLAEINRKLYRPTQLDAGGHAWHFPSHPRDHDSAKSGGQAMALGNSKYAGLPLPEFIHTQADCLTERHVVAVAKTTDSSRDGLVKRRSEHRERLRQLDPPTDDRKWYPQRII